MRNALPASGLFLLLVYLPFLGCSSRLIKKEEMQRISKDYEKIYVLKERVEIGNFDTLNKGAKLRIYFKAAGEYITVYAYPHSQPREEAVGKNIMQIFEGDFPDKKFREDIFRQKIATLLEEYTGKLDKLPKGNSFGDDLSKGKMPGADGAKPSSRGGRRGRRGR